MSNRITSVFSISLRFHSHSLCFLWLRRGRHQRAKNRIMIMIINRMWRNGSSKYRSSSNSSSAILSPPEGFSLHVPQFFSHSKKIACCVTWGAAWIRGNTVSLMINEFLSMPRQANDVYRTVTSDESRLKLWYTVAAYCWPYWLIMTMNGWSV